MSEQVKRWEHSVTWAGLQIVATTMALREDGKYVLSADYDALAHRCLASEDEAHRNRMDLVNQVERCDAMRAEIERLTLVNKQLLDPIVRARMLVPPAPIVVCGGLEYPGTVEAGRLRSIIVAARDKLAPALRHGHPGITEQAAADVLAMLEGAL